MGFSEIIDWYEVDGFILHQGLSRTGTSPDSERLLSHCVYALRDGANAVENNDANVG
jgi:hypothetical protein